MTAPKKGFNERFEDDEQDEEFDSRKKTEKKYDTCRERTERAEKERTSRTGNASTDDDEWS